jgi:hypothetical protein
MIKDFKAELNSIIRMCERLKKSQDIESGENQNTESQEKKFEKTESLPILDFIAHKLFLKQIVKEILQEILEENLDENG